MSKDIGFCSITEDLCKKDGKCEDCSLKHILDNIEYYAKLHEENRLIELPCKVGDTVYCITIDNNIHNLPVQDIYHALVLKSNKTGELRKGYYRTKAEAEAKLAKLKGE